MPRSVRITLPADRTDALVARAKELEGLIGVQVQRGVSLHPPGDVVSVDVTSAGLHMLMRLLDEGGLGRDTATSVVTEKPLSVVSAEHAEAVARDASDATWEEIEQTIGHESNMTVNGLLLMITSGVIAAIGIATDAVHLVIGAMIIAPGFEPVSRVSLGLVGRSAAWRRGLLDTGKGYAALALGAAVTAVVLAAFGSDPLGGREATYLSDRALVRYWTSFTPTSLAASVVGAVGGAVLLTANRPVLTAGVMVALALVPTAALAAMAAVGGDWPTTGKALVRWAVEVGFVTLLSAVVFAWKKARLLRRRMHV